MMKVKNWFITGSTRGLGRSLTERVLREGDNVIATGRKVTELSDLSARYPGKVLPLELDVTNTDQVEKTIQTALAHFGIIDVLVNNAGFGITGATEAFTKEQVDSQLDVNLYAPIAITRAIIPHMRRQGAGRILQISSVAGRLGSCGLSIYTAAKFGLTGFSESLNEELRPLNIFVTAIEPGGFKTDWGKSSMSFAPSIDGYQETVDQRVAYFTSGKANPQGDPDRAAAAMIAVVNHVDPPIHLVLGSQAIGWIKEAERLRTIEMETWMSLSESTDSVSK